jgi:large subunit GTPase 1
LEKYIKEVDKNRGKKQFLLLINKADYLTQELREHWSKYFKENNVNHIFFSALLEQEKIDAHEDDDAEDAEEEVLVDKEEEKKQLDEEAKTAL